MRKKSGFTLAEIIIVIAVTLFLFTATMQGLINSSAQFNFRNQDDRLQAMLRTARSLAISGKAQPDYIDYNKNLCTDVLSSPGCTAPDLVTPAHYGVIFRKLDSMDVVSLFVDNHSKDPKQEGYYESGDPHNGYDVVLDYFILPKGMELILPDAGNEATIFFSPIFADVTTNINIPADKPIFKFGISQTQGNVVRKRCSQIQMLAGISEPLNETPTMDPSKCP